MSSSPVRKDVQQAPTLEKKVSSNEKKINILMDKLDQQAVQITEEVQTPTHEE